MFSVLLLLFCCFILGCDSKNEIKSISVDGKTYYTVYLYSFDNASISDNYKVISVTPVDCPTIKGYSLSKERNADRIEVWNQFYFVDDGVDHTSISSSDLPSIGINAQVVELIDTYPVSIKENKDTYTVTYYTYSYSTDTEIERLVDNSLYKHIIEVAKESALIEYYD